MLAKLPFAFTTVVFPAESLRRGEWTFSETYEFIQKPTSSKEPKTQQTSAYKHNIYLTLPTTIHQQKKLKFTCLYEPNNWKFGIRVIIIKYLRLQKHLDLLSPLPSLSRHEWKDFGEKC